MVRPGHTGTDIDADAGAIIRTSRSLRRLLQGRSCGAGLPSGPRHATAEAGIGNVPVSRLLAIASAPGGLAGEANRDRVLIAVNRKFRGVPQTQRDHRRRKQHSGALPSRTRTWPPRPAPRAARMDQLAGEPAATRAAPARILACPLANAPASRERSSLPSTRVWGTWRMARFAPSHSVTRPPPTGHPAAVRRD